MRSPSWPQARGHYAVAASVMGQGAARGWDTWVRNDLWCWQSPRQRNAGWRCGDGGFWRARRTRLRWTKTEAVGESVDGWTCQERVGHSGQPSRPVRLEVTMVAVLRWRSTAELVRSRRSRMASGAGARSLPALAARHPARRRISDSGCCTGGRPLSLLKSFAAGAHVHGAARRIAMCPSEQGQVGLPDATGRGSGSVRAVRNRRR